MASHGNVVKNSFFSSFGCYFKVLQHSGLLPINVSTSKNKTTVQSDVKASAYFILGTILRVSFVVYSHFNAHHDHMHSRSRIILRVTYLQITSIALTAVVGIVDSFVARHKFSLVKYSQLSI